MRLVLALLTMLVAGLTPGVAFGKELHAGPSTLSSVFASAQPGDVVLLSSGSYGRFSGGAKAGTVTVRADAGASASMAVDFTSAQNVTLDGLTITEANVGGTARNIAIVNSTFTGAALVDASTFNGNNVLFDRDRFDGIDACGQCYEGRLTVKGNNSNSATVGVAITNSHFGNGGGSDGVQIIGDAAGVQVGPGNEFSGIKQGSYAAHVDSIQLYGSSRTQIVGNYFHDNDTIIMAPDGGNQEYIAHNVMVGDGYAPAVQLGSHDGTKFVHNTVKDIDVHADAKSSSSPSRNVVVSDNVFHNGSTNATESLCSGCTVSYNLFSSSGDASGANRVVGTPVYAGGSSPQSWAGFALAAGSPGKGNASDGQDRGILLSAGGTGAPPAGGGTGGTGTGGSGGGGTGSPIALPQVLPGSTASPASGSGGSSAGAARLRLIVFPGVPRAGARVVLRAPKSRAHGRRCLWTIDRRVTRRGCKVAVRFKRPGRHRVALRIKHRSGAIVRGAQVVRVRGRR